MSASHFEALRHRNFRLLWLGQLVSFTGSNMQAAAVLWHVSLLAPEGSKALALGMVGLARLVPLLGFSLVSGVVADALDRRRIILVAQLAMATTSTILAVVTFRGIHALWPIYVLTALGFVAGSFDAPARQSLMPSLVPRDVLPNAISWASIMFQAAAALGPALAGVVIAGFGLEWAYASNAVSFLAVIVALLLMRDLPPRPAGDRLTVSFASSLEGLRFVFGSPLIKSTMLLDFAATLFASAMALLPIFAQDVLHVGPHGYGLLGSATAVGAGVTSLVLVRDASRIQRRGVVLLWAIAGYGAATALFGLSRWFWLSFVALALVGACDMVSTVLRNIVRQMQTPDRLRGRMTAVNMMFFMGGPQLGELEAGLMAQALGAPIAVVVGGIACVGVTVGAAARWPVLRRYHRDDDAHEARPPPS